MREISELIYETCKTYLIQQGKFLMILWLFIGAIVAYYFGALAPFADPPRAPWSTACRSSRVAIILLFSLVGIAGSYGVAWFGIRVNTYANSRTAFASLRGKPYPVLRDSAQGRHEHRHAAHQRRAHHHARHPALHPWRLRRPVLHRLRDRRVARRGGAAYRGRHLHEDRRHRRGPDEDRLQDQGRRRAQPGRHRGLHGRQRRRLGRPLGGRLRDLRRDGRRADLLHPARRDQRHDPDPAARVDLHDAHRHGHRVGRVVLDQRDAGQGAVPERRQDELRGAAHAPRVADVDRVGRADVRRVVPADSGRSAGDTRCGGSCRRSSRAARWPARSFRSS